MQNVHPPSSTPPAWDSRQKKSRTRAPGLSSARGTIWGARGSRVRLTDGLARTKQTPTSVPTVPYSIPDSPPVSCTAGRQPRWRTHWKSRAMVENPGFWRGCSGDGKWRRSAETRMVRRHSGLAATMSLPGQIPVPRCHDDSPRWLQLLPSEAGLGSAGQAKLSTVRCSCQVSGRRECASSLSAVRSRG